MKIKLALNPETYQWLGEPRFTFRPQHGPDPKKTEHDSVWNIIDDSQLVDLGILEWCW